jgi:hypothetical protein
MNILFEYQGTRLTGLLNGAALPPAIAAEFSKHARIGDAVAIQAPGGIQARFTEFAIQNGVLQAGGVIDIDLRAMNWPAELQAQLIT